MELPKPTIVPPWTQYNYPSLNTRPFLSIHRSQYCHIPRLFPAQLNAYRVARLQPTEPLVWPGSTRDSSNASQRNTASLESTFGSLAVNSCNSHSSQSQRSGPPSSPGVAQAQRLEAHKSDDPAPEASKPARRAPARRASRAPFHCQPNTITTVCVGDEAYAVCAPGGRISNSAIYGIGETRSEVRVRCLSTPQNGANFSGAYERTGAIFSIAARDSNFSAEAARVAFCSPASVWLASIGDGPSFSWNAELQLSGATLCGAAFGHSCGEELLTLCTDGLRLHALDAGGASTGWGTGTDFWPISNRRGFFSVSFGAHPRVALLASRKGLHRVDLRSHPSASRGTRVAPIFDLGGDWGVAASDEGLRVFEKHCAEPFWSVVASDHILAVVDERMARTPLLTASLSGSASTPATLACMRSVSPGNMSYGQAIALGTPRDGTVALYHLHSGSLARAGSLSSSVRPFSSEEAHACVPGGGARSLSTSGASSSMSGPVGATRPSQKSRERAVRAAEAYFPLPPLLWSDLPLTHFQSYAPTEGLSGLTLLPHPSVSVFGYFDPDKSPQTGACMSLVQVSRCGGIVAQLLGCNAFEDEDRAFEAEERYMTTNAERGRKSGQGGRTMLAEAMDTTRALRDIQVACSDSLNLERILDRVNDGVRTLQAMKRLPAAGTSDLRRRILSSEDDEVHTASHLGAEKTKIARPKLSDRPLVLRERSQVNTFDFTATHVLEATAVIPQTLPELLQVTRTPRPHCPTPVAVSDFLDLVEDIPGVVSYDVAGVDVGGSDEVKEWRVQVFSSASGKEYWGSNEATEVVPGTPFAQELAEFEDIFYKRTIP